MVNVRDVIDWLGFRAKISLFFLYSLSIFAVGAGFLVIRSFGRRLTAPPPGSVSATAHTAAKAPAADLLHILLALVIIVATARLIGMCFRALHQPPVIGEIIAGIMLGPSLLGRIAPSASAYLFPATVVPALSVVSQVGVILFMFLVGAELDSGLLRKHGHSTIAISHASILAPFFLGAVLSLLLYPRISSGDIPFTNFALFLGVSMSVTAFPVLARILTDRNMHKTRMGAIALTCAAVDDVTAWCLLALVVGVAQAESTGFIKIICLALAYVALMVLVIRPAMKRLILVYGNKGRLTQGLMATIFVMLLLSASATEMIGIHAVFGAFAFGAMIPHDSGMARELVDKLEDLVVVLLLPAFFAITGLRTQIGLISGAEQWAWCGLIIAVASIGKFGGSLVAGRITGLSWSDSSALGVLMNTRGLMELIVLNIGYEMHIISPTLFAMMVLMALVTTVATTPILHLLGRDEAKAPVADSRRDASTDEPRVGVLVPVANPKSVRRLVDLALAATPPGMRPPRVLALVRPPAGGVRTGLDDDDGRMAPRSAALGAALKWAWRQSAVITPQAMWSDNPAGDLVKVAMELGIEWIVLGPHRAVFGTDFRGGVVQEVLDRARTLPINIAVAIQAIDAPANRIFVVADATYDGCAALNLAARMALRQESDLYVIQIDGEPSPLKLEFSRALAQASRGLGRRLHSESMLEPSGAMLAERTASSLVVIGAGVAELMGLSRRGFTGFPDGHPMVLVQGSRFTQSSSSAVNDNLRTARL